MNTCIECTANCVDSVKLFTAEEYSQAVERAYHQGYMARVAKRSIFDGVSPNDYRLLAESWQDSKTRKELEGSMKAMFVTWEILNHEGTVSGSRQFLAQQVTCG